MWLVFKKKKTQPQAINEDSLVSEVAAQHHLAKWYIYMSKKDLIKKHNTKVCLQYKNVAVPSEHEGSLISLFKEVHIKTHMVIRRVREIFIQFVVVDLTRD